MCYGMGCKYEDHMGECHKNYYKPCPMQNCHHCHQPHDTSEQDSNDTWCNMCVTRFEEERTSMKTEQCKYLLCPGWVHDSHGEQSHYISAQQLVVLYNVHYKYCLINSEHRLRGLKKEFIEKLIKLRPKEDGVYEPPACQTDLNDVLF